MGRGDAAKAARSCDDAAKAARCCDDESGGTAKAVLPRGYGLAALVASRKLRTASVATVILSKQEEQLLGIGFDNHQMHNGVLRVKRLAANSPAHRAGMGVSESWRLLAAGVAGGEMHSVTDVGALREIAAGAVNVCLTLSPLEFETPSDPVLNLRHFLLN